MDCWQGKNQGWRWTMTDMHRGIQWIGSIRRTRRSNPIQSTSNPIQTLLSPIQSEPIKPEVVWFGHRICKIAIRWIRSKPIDPIDQLTFLKRKFNTTLMIHSSSNSQIIRFSHFSPWTSSIEVNSDFTTCLKQHNTNYLVPIFWCLYATEENLLLLCKSSTSKFHAFIFFGNNSKFHA